MSLKAHDKYVTVRDIAGDGSKDGSFFVNVHKYAGGNFIESSMHEYNQKRSARRAARKLAVKKGYEYRQDKEYTGGNFPKMTAPLGTEASGVCFEMSGK
jgi:hypothetical protein